MAESIRSYKQLSSKAKERVLEKFNDINVKDYEWYEFTIEDFKKETMANFGFEFDKFYFDLYPRSGYFNSITFWDVKKLLEKANCQKEVIALEMDGEVDDMEVRNITSTRYQSNIVEVSLIYKEDSEVYNGGEVSKDDEEAVVEMERKINYLINGLAEELVKKLGDEYDYLTSKEAVEDAITNNNFRFDRDGEMVC